MPERLSGSGFHGLEGFRIVTEENQATRSRHCASGGTAVTRLGISPFERAGFQVIREQDFFAGAARDAFDTGRIVLTAFGEFLGLTVKDAALLKREEVEKMGGPDYRKEKTSWLRQSCWDKFRCLRRTAPGGGEWGAPARRCPWSNSSG